MEDSINHISIVKELEVKDKLQRHQYIRSILDAWHVSYQLQNYATGTNIFIQPTIRPYIGIASHFDVVPGGPGANDNASAVAVVLNL
jgi:acetylornithine deacetylase/succinyl-diaminopimelate desuccinylase-like protein